MMPVARWWQQAALRDSPVGRAADGIMTTTPNAEMAELHDRMPVILEQQDWPTWLGETEGDATMLMRPAPDGLLRAWPVDRRVGSPRNNGPELLEAMAE
jgi:putative SOS response-associated peptidase YedK